MARRATHNYLFHSNDPENTRYIIGNANGVFCVVRATAGVERISPLRR
jgi:hypothetical protein